MLEPFLLRKKPSGKLEMRNENKKFIEYLKQTGHLKSKKLEKTLLAMPRHEFVPQGLRTLAYKDFPLSIGFNQTISQPSTVVIMTELLEVKSGERILEIGTGSGWQAVLLAKLAGAKGKVYTIEIIKELCIFAKKNIEKMKIKNVFVFHRDGSLGLKEYAPFDKIIVTAACQSIPEVLIRQLKVNGRLVAPVGSSFMQKMVVVKKTKKGLEKQESPGYFVFVPLVGKGGFG